MQGHLEYFSDVSFKRFMDVPRKGNMGFSSEFIFLPCVFQRCCLYLEVTAWLFTSTSRARSEIKVRSVLDILSTKCNLKVL